MYNVTIRNSKPLTKYELISALMSIADHLRSDSFDSVISWKDGLNVHITPSQSLTILPIMGQWVRRGNKTGNVIDVRDHHKAGRVVKQVRVNWQYANNRPANLSTTWVTLDTVKNIPDPHYKMSML